MLKYPCLVLDHDDTVVMSEVTVNYPCFLLALEKFRPGETMDYPEFVRWCLDYEFTDFLRIKYGFSDAELEEEYRMWLEYAKTHIPPACDGIREIILEQKRRGGLVCVASLSGRENILRDYRLHFGMEPDLIFSRDDPREQRKPSPYPLQKIMEVYGLSPSEILMVDDLKTGVDMAKAAGVEIAAALWCRQNVPEVGDRMRKWCHHAFDDPRALYDLLFPHQVVPHRDYTLYVHSYDTVYDRGPIERITLDPLTPELGCEVRIHFRDGSRARWLSKEADIYLTQFGVASSPDGSRVYIQTWTKGLFCLDARTGERIWRTESKRGITNLFVGKDTITCQQHDHAMLLLNAATGEVLKEKRPSTAWGFTNLDSRLIVCHSTARRWELIDASTLDVLEHWSHSAFTGGHLDYVIHHIKPTQDGHIQVIGFRNHWDNLGNRLPNLEFTHILKSNALSPCLTP